MQHYLVDLTDDATVETNFPHTPTNRSSSWQDYLEDKLNNGWELLSWANYNGSSTFHICFRLIGK